jgi:hypothetical protein
MRLLDTEEFARPRLRQAALLDDLVDLQRQAGLEQLLLRRSANTLPLLFVTRTLVLRMSILPELMNIAQPAVFSSSYAGLTRVSMLKCDSAKPSP